MKLEHERALFLAMTKACDSRPYVWMDMRAIIGELPPEMQKPAWRTLEKWERQGFLQYGTSIAGPWFASGDTPETIPQALVARMQAAP